jgi:hypothetical protein
VELWLDLAKLLASSFATSTASPASHRTPRHEGSRRDLMLLPQHTHAHQRRSRALDRLELSNLAGGAELEVAGQTSAPVSRISAPCRYLRARASSLSTASQKCAKSKCSDALPENLDNSSS